MKKLKSLAYAFGGVFLVISLVALQDAKTVLAAAQANSASGTTAESSRAAGVDGNGTPYRLDSDRGFKVFVYGAQTAGKLVVDEAGNKPTCGQVHQVCVLQTTGPSNPNEVYVYDTSAVSLGEIDTAKITTTMLGGVVVDSAKVLCSAILDAQFNNGLGVSLSVATDTAWVYWKACKAKSQ